MSAKPTTRIRVRDGDKIVAWQVPRGFGKDYKWRARNNGPKPSQLLSLLELVGYTARLEDVEQWSLFRRVQAEAYAARLHLNASDNGLQRHPRPKWMRAPWGEEETKGDSMGIYTGRGPTVLT